MLDTKPMPNFFGQLNRAVIDAPPKLDAPARTHFLASLLDWQTDIRYKRGLKVNNMVHPHQLTYETHEEKQLLLNYELYTDYMLGPVSFIQMDMDLKLIDETIGYTLQNPSMTDVELYRHLENFESDRPASVKRDKIRINAHGARIDENNEIIDEDVRDPLIEQSMGTVFELFRLARYDMLTPFEQKMMLIDSRNYFPLTAELEHSFTDLACRSIKKEMPKEPSVLDVLPMNMRHFINLCDGFRQSMDAAGNDSILAYQIKQAQNSSYHFSMMQRMAASFENMQILYHHEIIKNIHGVDEETNLGNFCNDISKKDFCQDIITRNEYAAYFDDKGLDARINLEPPSEEDDYFHMNAINFSDTVYANPTYEDEFMNYVGRKHFDAMLQKDIDRIAEKLNKPAPDIVAFRDATRGVKPIIG